MAFCGQQKLKQGGSADVAVQGLVSEPARKALVMVSQHRQEN